MKLKLKARAGAHPSMQALGGVCLPSQQTNGRNNSNGSSESSGATVIAGPNNEQKSSQAQYRRYASVAWPERLSTTRTASASTGTGV